MFDKAMVRGLLVAALAATMLDGTATRVWAGTFSTVDISSQANSSWLDVAHEPGGNSSGIVLPGAPTGSVTLGGIPFNITSNAAGNQAWNADTAAGGGSGQESMTVPVSEYGVSDVYTLINTVQGQPGPTSYAWLIFTGSGGATYTDYLVGGIDIRDYNNDDWENNIDGTTTVNVFSCPDDNWGISGRLDMQHIVLPAAFASQTLSTIQLVDNGGPNFQRAVLDGVTVESIPEPATVTLLCSALLGPGVVYLWRRRAKA
jgi:hypothetical protein